MPIAHLNEGGVCFLVQIEKNDEDIKKEIDENHFKQYLEQEKFKNPGFGVVLGILLILIQWYMSLEDQE